MEWVTLRDDAFYQKMKIELVRDEIVELDTKARSLALKSGRKVSYDKLMLATGSEPVRLPIDGASLPHVKTLRTLADSQAIIDAAAKARRAVVIGSSFIGLEVAASLRARNLEVDVVSSTACHSNASWVRRWAGSCSGCTKRRAFGFACGAKLRGIHADAVELEDGRKLAAEVVVLGVGVKPRIDLAKRAGLEVEDGILVDSRLRTSAPDVWAAGDVARYPEARLGTKIRGRALGRQRSARNRASLRDMLGLGGPVNDVPSSGASITTSRSTTSDTPAAMPRSR